VNKLFFVVIIGFTFLILQQIHAGNLGIVDINRMAGSPFMEENLTDPADIDAWNSFDVAPYQNFSQFKSEGEILNHIKRFFSFREQIQNPAELRILAFGDMMLGRHVATLMDRNGKNYVFEKLLDEDGNFFWDADVVHANLEGPIKGQGIKGGTSMVFSFHEDVAPFLKESGFDVLSIANNHSLDQGWGGRDSTISGFG
jgi:hypothetical protein